MNNDNLRQTLKEENDKRILANKLINGELGVCDLSETEVDEMTEYFMKDIQYLDNEMLRIKQHIIAMKQQLKQS